MGERVAQGPLWRGQADTKQRRLWAWLGFSLLLHLPVTPLAALVGLLSLLGLREPDVETPPEELEGIPVTLLSAEELAQLGADAPPPAEPPPPAAPAEPPAPEAPPVTEAPKPPLPKPPPPKPEPEAVADAGAPDAEPEKPAPEPADAGKGETEPGPKPAEQAAADPLALAGAAASVADPNANVKLLLFNERIRNHPLGPRIGRLVTRLPQWSSFFGPTDLDPVRDIETLYVAGPQLRVSADVVAVVRYKVPEAAMKRALDAIVEREPKGEWLKDTPVPAARARADRAERTFVMTRPGMLLMVPPRLTQDALDKGPKLGLPSLASDSALVAMVATPWRAFIGLGLPVQIPETIRSASIRIVPAPDGGVLIHLDAVDESAEAAARNAELLTRAINLATQRNLGALGSLLFGGETLQLLEPVELSAKGSRITGTAKATPRQVDRILNFAESFLDALANRPAPRASADSTLGKAPAPRGSADSALGKPPPSPSGPLR